MKKDALLELKKEILGISTKEKGNFNKFEKLRNRVLGNTDLVYNAIVGKVISDYCAKELNQNPIFEFKCQRLSNIELIEKYKLSRPATIEQGEFLLNVCVYENTLFCLPLLYSRFIDNEFNFEYDEEKDIYTIEVPIFENTDLFRKHISKRIKK